MPVNPLAKPKNAGDTLLGVEDLDTQAKRGYATAQPTTTFTGRPLNYGDIYNTSSASVPDYIQKEGARLREQAAARGVPSAGAVRATGLSDIEALRAAAAAEGGLPAESIPTSTLAQNYISRASNGVNAIFGGASGENRPDLSKLLPSELANYQSLARTTGTLPTAEAAAGYENLLPSEREKLKATINAASNNPPDLRGTGLSHTAIAGALRLAREQGTQ